MGQKRFLGLTCVCSMLIFLSLGGLIFIVLNFISNNNNKFYKLGFTNISLIPITIFLLIGIIGISKRIYLIYNLILASFGLLALSSLYNLIVSLIYEYQDMKIFNYEFLLFLSFLVIWYLIRRKEYFKDSNKVIDFENTLLKKEEIFFTTAFVLLWLVYFVILQKLTS